jgi:hypothetical protein
MHHHIKEEWNLKFNKLFNILFPKKNELMDWSHTTIKEFFGLWIHTSRT